MPERPGQMRSLCRHQRSVETGQSVARQSFTAFQMPLTAAACISKSFQNSQKSFLSGGEILPPKMINLRSMLVEMDITNGQPGL